MPATVIPASSAGIAADWEVLGGTYGWEVLGPSSLDGFKIRSQTLLENSSFYCGAGYCPPWGIITAVTLHYRMRQTVAGAGAVVDVNLLRSGADQNVGTINLTSDSWIDGEVRVREDWLTAVRFVQAGVGLIGCGVELNTAPAGGYAEVSRLWVEVEYLDTHTFYDPYWAALPDAVLGEMAWVNSGASAVALVGNELRITDNSAAWRNYSRTELDYGDDYITEYEIRVEFSAVTLSATEAFCYHLGIVDDSTRSVHLAIVSYNSQAYVGLTGDGLDHDDFSAYLATDLIDTVTGTSLYFRMVIDRDPDPFSWGYVEVYNDYSDTPILSVPYVDFPTIATNQILFGSGDAVLTGARSTGDIDFVAWHHYKKRETLFKQWNEVYIGTNDVQASSTDAFIWHPIELNPPGLVTGQSDYCCVLAVADATVNCYVEQLWQLPDVTPTNYNVIIDYRMDVLATTGYVSVQRISDHYYWNEGGAVWQAAAINVTIPNQMLRTRTTFMTKVGVATSDVLLIRIGSTVGAEPAHNMFIYKVGVAE